MFSQQYLFIFWSQDLTLGSALVSQSSCNIAIFNFQIWYQPMHWLISNLKMQMLEPTGFDHIQAKKQKQRNSLPKLWNFSATAIFIHSLPFSHPCQECVTANVFCWFVSFARSCCSSVGLGHSHSTPSVWYFHSDLYLVHSGDVFLAIACNAFQCY